ncbi:transcription terminating nucleic-acid-binding protein [Sphingopyxis sp. H115]|nr:transcription terminating nucleic-acid-binding protein [Sphingopyxis sp. H115]
MPERRCVITGDVSPAERLVRLALGPDGSIAPDVHGKAPGRGAWIGVSRAELEAAQTKGKLKGGLARALHESHIAIPDDLGARIEAQLQRATLDRLGLESRSGTLISGNEKIETAARKGQVRLLLHASDAGEDGRKKLAQAWRVGDDAEGSGREGLVLPVDRGTLSMALGRENAVHLAITDARAADRVLAHLSRWQFFTGWSRDAANRDSDPHASPPAGEEKTGTAPAGTAASDAF